MCTREKEEKEKEKKEKEREEKREREKVVDGKRVVYLKEAALSFSCLGGARSLAHRRWISKVVLHVSATLYSRIAPRIAHVGVSSSIACLNSPTLSSWTVISHKNEHLPTQIEITFYKNLYTYMCTYMNK